MPEPVMALCAPEKIQTTRTPRTRRCERMRGSAGGKFLGAYEPGLMFLTRRIDSEKLRYSRDRFLWLFFLGDVSALFEYFQDRIGKRLAEKFTYFQRNDSVMSSPKNQSGC